MKKMITVLCGGGLETSALLVLLKEQLPQEQFEAIVPVHIAYGQKAYAGEKAAIQSQIEILGIKTPLVEMKLDMGYSKSAIMENSEGDTANNNHNRLELRNPTFLTFVGSYLASTYPGLHHKMYVGFRHESKDTPFPDGDYNRYAKRLSKVLNSCLTKGSGKFSIHAPLKDMSGKKIFKILAVMGHDYAVNKVHTCYESVTCNVCAHCVEYDKHIANFDWEKNNGASS